MHPARDVGAVDAGEDGLVLAGTLTDVGVQVQEPGLAGRAEQMWPGAVETKAA